MAGLTGKTLGKYQIQKRLGRGGMAEVYQGLHPQLERLTAIKVLYPHLAEGEDFLTRFQREAKAIAALNHPNIVQVYDFDIEGDNYYMVMEFIDGPSLKEHIQESQGPLPGPEISKIIRQTASALDYAHSKGIFHRDVKPANILLCEDRVVLSDFGIAHILSDTHLTATGALVGTPDYMSPEQGKGLSADQFSDIYSLGVILYEMVTGNTPYQADTPLSVIYKHVNEPLPSPRKFVSDLPTQLEAVIFNALAKEPGDRYPSAGALSEALDRALADLDDIPASQISTAQAEILEQKTVRMESGPPEEATILNQKTKKMKAAPASKQKSPEKTASEPEAEPASVPPAGEKIPQKRKLPLPWILGLVGAGLLIVLLAFGIPGLNLGSGAGSCGSLEACELRWEENMSQGDFEAAVTAMDQAIDRIPAGENQAYAHLFCQRGEALGELDLLDDAIANFEECIMSTEGDPAQEDLRIAAEEQIRMLEERR